MLFFARLYIIKDIVKILTISLLAAWRIACENFNKQRCIISVDCENFNNLAASGLED